MKITTYLFSLLFAFNVFAQFTNNLRPGDSALMLDTNSLIVAPTNFWAVNAAGLNAVVTGGGSGGATNGILQLNGHGTNTSLIGATLDGASAIAGQTGTAVATAASAVASSSTNNTANTLVLRDANGGFQNGHATFSSISTQTEAVLAKATGGTDNAITAQNTDNTHYSAMRFVDLSNQETGAVGFGNYGAPFYMGIDYLESYGNGYGFYFTSGGKVNGGLQRHTGHFVWSDGSSATDTNMPLVLDVDQHGNITNAGNVVVGGALYEANSSALPIITTNGLLDGRFIPNNAAQGDLNIRTIATQGPANGSGTSGGAAVQVAGVSLSELDYGLTITSATGDMLTLEPTGASTPRLMLKQNLPFYWASNGWGTIGTPALPVGYGYWLTNAMATEVVTNSLTAGNITVSAGITNSALTASTFIYADANKKLSSGTISTGVSLSNGTLSATFTPSTTDTLQNKTVSTTATGGNNTIKMRGYIVLAAPMLCDGTGAIIQTNDYTKAYWGQAQFSATAATNANYIEYRLTVPEDFDSSADWKVERWKFRLAAADTAAQKFNIGMASVADSASFDSSTIGQWNLLSFAGDASGASGDVETISGVTLTGWKSNLTAGQLLVIRLNRDGANDASTVASFSGPLVLSYGVSQ